MVDLLEYPPGRDSERPTQPQWNNDATRRAQATQPAAQPTLPLRCRYGTILKTAALPGPMAKADSMRLRAGPTENIIVNCGYS